MRNRNGLSLAGVVLAAGGTGLVAAQSDAAQIVSVSFEETSGTLAVDAIGSPASNGIVDTDEDANLGGPDLNVPGIVGSGISLDGLDDGVRFGDTSEFKGVGNSASEFTFVVWVKDIDPQTAGPFERIFDNTNTNQGAATVGGRGWRLNTNGSDVTLQVLEFGSANNINHTFTTLRDFNDDGWSLVALRYDVTGGDNFAEVSILYDSDSGVDASFVDANTETIAGLGTITFGSLAQPRLGHRSDNLSTPNNLAASFDELGYFDTALTDAELAAYFLNVVPEPSSLALLAVGGGLIVARRRRSGTKASA
ncbi:MAG: PEP-CTERM sorting domain-containing protein [Planctomycetota bacterium]